MSSNTTENTQTTSDSDFKTVGKRNNKKQFQKGDSNKPRLSFKELLFELNNLKKYQHSPKVDLYERNNSYVIRMELPGLTRNDINVQVRDGQFLLISGTKQNLTSYQDDNTIYAECHYGNFMRRVKVPNSVNRDTIKINMSNGVLVLTVDKLPRVEETVDPRLDDSYDSYETTPQLEPIPEGKVIDFSDLGNFTGKSWADEI
jgi:HSP20 family protein